MLLVGAYLLLRHSGMVRRIRPGTYEHGAIPKLAQVCVHGFRALGLHPSPGMTNISDFLTASCAGRTSRGASH